LRRLQFVDIDECVTNTDECSSRATCYHSEGSYYCTCNAGYTGDGFTCTGNYRLLYTSSRPIKFGPSSKP